MYVNHLSRGSKRNLNVHLFMSTTGTRKRYLETNIQAPVTNDYWSTIKDGSYLTVAKQFPFFVLYEQRPGIGIRYCPTDTNLEMGVNVNVNINAS
jgi:hypothetical protein